MTDQIDDANLIADAFLAKAKAESQKMTITVKGMGWCLWCGQALGPRKRWCDAECCDAFEADVAAEQRRIRMGGRME